MKAVVVALATLLLLPQEDEAAKKAQRIERALAWLVNEEAEVREMGRKELLAIGSDAIPALEKKIAEKGAAELMLALRQLEKAAGLGHTWVDESELKELEADEQFKKEAAKLGKDVAERYIYVKYHEALAHVRQKRYQRAFDIANGLIAFEPGSPHMNAFRLLRRHCENLITQTSLIEAKIFQPKLWYLEGEPVELTARMKNIYKASILMTWDKATAADPGGGMLVCEVDLTMSALGGTSSTDQRHQELRFEEEVPIAPGAQWERRFTLDTSTAIADSKQIRVVRIGGWTQPAKIVTDGVNITRRLQFEPALVKILPKRYAHFLENPLAQLEKMIAEGGPQDIYICSQLLEGADKDRGTEMLIQLLAKSNTLTSKTYAANLLTALTGQSLGTDPKRWETWFTAKGDDHKDKKKR